METKWKPNRTRIRNHETFQGRIEMLVLSRKVGEKLVIGKDITVEIMRISGNRITLGLVAPADVKILRSELQPIAAATSSGSDVAVQTPLLHAS